jgi:hypothetical protein
VTLKQIDDVGFPQDRKITKDSKNEKKIIKSSQGLASW